MSEVEIDMETVIKVSGLTKRYRLGVIGGATLGDDLKAGWAKLRGKPNPLIPLDSNHDEARVGEHFYALRNVDFEVEKGEILGIVGRNGAGKSTLLKLLSRITTPTEGSIKIKGRTSSLLEVGTGFHPELTGKENIYLNGAILGMRRVEIDAKLEEIVDFSGIKHHIDTPVKRYSSGMKVRLGFAVAAHLEPEVLIIDEVLAVGDADFQRKCIGKMKDVAGSGRTILFVSHNMVSVRSLCTRVLWMNEGKIVKTGPTEEVVREYLNNYVTASAQRSWNEDDAPGTDDLKLTEVALRRANKEQILMCGEPFRIEIKFVNRGVATGDLRVNIHLINGADILVLASALVEGLPDEQIGTPGTYRYSCEMPGDLLNADDYKIVVNFVHNRRLLCRCDDTIGFQIHHPIGRDGVFVGRKRGIVRPILKWSKL